MERGKSDREADAGVKLGKRMSVEKYIGICPRYVHRYFLEERKKKMALSFTVT